MAIDWNAVAFTIVGAVGYLMKVVVDVIRTRYEQAKALKKQQETREDKLIRSLYEWREHAYVVRKIALDAGVRPDELPEKPESNDA